MPRKMDPKLVASRQRHEVSYLGRKYRLRNDYVLSVLRRYGRSREKIKDVLRRQAARERRLRRLSFGRSPA